MTPPVDREALLERLEDVNSVMASHVGGVELVDVSPDGVVRLRFTGMCTGCQLRPLTTAYTIEPALLELEGVTAVHADGARISREAAQRLLHYMGPPL